MEIKILEEAGFEWAMEGLARSFNQDIAKMPKVALNLSPKDMGHNKFLESIVVWIRINAPRFWWSEFDTYRVGITKQSDCFDSSTEILTSSGWKFFKDLDKKEDLVCTLNKDTFKIEYQLPNRHIEDYYEGAMIHLKSKKYDLMVTPNHNIPIINESNGKIKTIEAAFFKNHHKIPKNIFSYNIGNKEEYFILPEENCTWNTGFRECIKHYPPLSIKMDDWLSFFGIWLSEGRTAKEARNYNTMIYQNDDNECFEELKALFERLPFKVNHVFLGEKRHKWTISNKQLYKYLHNIGNTYNKYIPRDYFDLPAEQLNILLKWLMYGDGTDHIDNYTYLYSTVSEQLADDVQELFVRTGNISNKYIRKDERKNKYKDVYTINRSLSKTYKIQQENIKEIDYKGNIYCVEVPNHIVLVRRNGKVTWSGNSTMHTLKRQPLTQDNFEYPIYENYIDVLNDMIRCNADIDIIKNALPDGFIQGRTICTNYKVLRNIILQRRNHKLPQWHYFCNEMKKLKYAEYLGIEDWQLAEVK